jgi:hypothetical protein
METLPKSTGGSRKGSLPTLEINNMSPEEYIQKRFEESGLKQTELGRLTAHMRKEQTISQTQLNYILKGSRFLKSWNWERLETLRRVLGITVEEWQENVGLELPERVDSAYSTLVSENPNFSSNSVILSQPQNLGGIRMAVTSVAFSSSSVSVLNAQPNIKDFVVETKYVTPDLSLIEYRGDTLYRLDGTEFLMDGDLAHVHTNDIDVQAGKAYVFVVAGPPLIMRAREIFGVLCFANETETYRVSEVGIVGRVVGRQQPFQED